MVLDRRPLAGLCWCGRRLRREERRGEAFWMLRPSSKKWTERGGGLRADGDELIDLLGRPLFDESFQQRLGA